MSSDEKIISLILLSLSTAFLGVTTGGCLKAAPLVARHYAAFVTGNISLAMSFTMLLVPITVSNIAPDNTPLQWRYVSAKLHSIF
uniref:Aa_trans domain-containing protein n=1 Tax=Ascaris lumbricoides TaxID=6252 RepID=A0A0M3HG38_ASCLU